MIVVVFVVIALKFLDVVHGWTSRVQEFNVFMKAFSIFMDLFCLLLKNIRFKRNIV